MVEIIAECGINHNGSLERAIQMCDAAKKAGATIAKFQTYIPEKCIRQGEDYALLSKLALGLGEFYELSKYCDSIGIEFCSTPDDLDSLNFLVSVCKVKRIKLGSGSLTYEPLVKAACLTGLPVILSTGMATIGEIKKAIDIWRDNKPVGDLTLMHCVSLYPCPDELANVKAIQGFREMWHIGPHEDFLKAVGYSDHTLGDDAICAAVALGANIVEKHFTLDKNDIGPDHKVSMNPIELDLLIKRVRRLEVLLGHGKKELSEQEKAMIPRVRKDSEGFQPGL